MRTAHAALILAGLLAAANAHATTTVVPNNYATIQAAINANADTVYVEGGSYNETVNITHAVYLTADERTHSVNIPYVLRLTSPTYVDGAVTVRGFRFLGGASVSASSFCDFTLCRADSGLVCLSQGVARVKGCTVFGSLTISGFSSETSLNTVVSGTLVAAGNIPSYVTTNLVTGPAACGIKISGDTYASNNIVRGCVDGISVGCGSSTGAMQNVVEDCSGRGIYGPTPAGPCGGDVAGNYFGNTVRRCGGVGIEVSGSNPTIDGNTVDSTGGVGMNLNVITDHVDNNRVTRANGAGILANILPGHMRGNTVLHCSGNGIQVGDCPLIDHNVVGHNGAAGIKVETDFGFACLRSNTSYSNAGPGFSLPTSDATLDSVSNNISYGNSVGFQRLGAGSIALACNDWFGNIGGATSGVAVGGSDFALNPLFCNLPADVVTLAAASPAFNRVGCGLVGALGQGCATPTAVGYGGESGGASLRAYPQPNHGVVRFAWRPVAEPVRLEVYDAQGALRLTRDVSGGAQEYALRTDTGGRVLPAGIYFARLHGAAGELGTCRVVVLN